MCVPGCHEAVHRALSRRGFFKGTAAVAAAGALSLAPAASAQEVKFSKVVDLTHMIWPAFPTFFGKPNLEVETLTTIEKDGFNTFRWHLVEHTGTHMDAPFHFSPDGMSADQLPLSMLIVPLVVVDIRAKAEENPDAQLTLEDLQRWERHHGRIPRGACVAMNSGWADKVDTPEFRNADENGVLHFPGFRLDAAQFLLEERQVNGIAVDTLSLDYGPSPDFAVHYLWLPTNRWGMEAVANLDSLPPRGATLIVGSPKIAGCTGGITRLIALVPRGNGDD